MVLTSNSLLVGLFRLLIVLMVCVVYGEGMGLDGISGLKHYHQYVLCSC